ncbi:HET-domain-containing protein [Jackrogersella minutella]|nr:HET-domain-containing protein [Jackrogersella minutella]
MRLIHTRSLEMEEFFGDQIPEYAILSHTWEKGEATFQDWTKLDNSIREKPGYVKITGACNQAKRDGFDWLWVDTNCIDKSSSAELTEAINSMFTWYRDARICYAYLQDVPSKDFSGQAEDVMAFFKKSKWFGRGWTLQELLAPTKVVFYTQEWKRIGSKAESLTSKIADITGIDEMFLDGSMALSASSISKRLSWIANRKTTRIEDMAYCLLGIFDINMPLLYGEGHKAFTRLQHEIIKSSSDHTIFCWTWNDDVPYDWTRAEKSDVLALVLSDFAGTPPWSRPELHEDVEEISGGSSGQMCYDWGDADEGHIGRWELVRSIRGDCAGN